MKITGYEKKLQGYIKKDKLYYYFDENGTILKISDEKIKLDDEDCINVSFPGYFDLIKSLTK